MTVWHAVQDLIFLGAITQNEDSTLKMTSMPVI